MEIGKKRTGSHESIGSVTANPANLENTVASKQGGKRKELRAEGRTTVEQVERVCPLCRV